MTFAHPWLLGFLGLIAIPIILHFLLRQKPKKLLFPALRLIQKRQRNNVRRMRLRHVWLMLLRILVIAFLVLAVAQPKLPAADYGLTNGETARLAAIGVVAVGAYFGLMQLWKRRRLAHSDFAYRRSLLRGGTGVGVLALLLLLVIWPYWRRIDAELSAPQPPAKEDAPVAAVFLFDTSASMEYRLESRTRLEQAQRVAEEFLESLPPRSRVAVGTSSDDGQVLFQADLTSARNRIKSLKTTHASLPLSTRVRTALLVQEEDRRRTLDADASTPEDQREDGFLREIYVFTDMARTAWREDDSKQLQSEMTRMPWASAYLIDVGVERPTNVAISGVKLSRQTVSEGSELVVEVALDAVGVESAARTVELYLNSERGPVKKGQSTITVDTQAGAKVAFTIPGVKGPLAQGEVRLISSDPLPGDDVRYFTAAVKPVPEILLVSESADDAAYLRLALAPTDLEQSGKARYKCKTVRPLQLESTNLDAYEAVCLINVRDPSTKAWDALSKYVSAGGGLAVFLGDSKMDSESYNSQAAKAILPVELLAQLGFRGDVFLDLQNLTHPILKKFDELGGVGELTASNVYRHWKTVPVEGATVIAHYTDDRETPALVERPFGQGRTVVLTTSVDLGGWSEIPRSWQFVVLADQMMQYLGRVGEGVYNYSAGEGAVLPLDRRKPLTEFLLRTPALEQLPGKVAADARFVTIDKTPQAGPYEIEGTETKEPFITGFSVNVPAGESDFTRLVDADLEVYFGKDRYRVAKDLGTLQRIVTTGRKGEEMFPFVVAFLIAVFVVEHLAANFFYEADQAGAATPRRQPEGAAT